MTFPTSPTVLTLKNTKGDSMAKRQLQWALTIFVGFIVFFGGGIPLVRHVIWPQIQGLPFVSNRQVVPFHEFHGLDPDVPNIIHGMARLQVGDTQQPFIQDGIVYLPMGFLAETFDNFLFWDAGGQVLIATTHEDTVVFRPGQERFYVNGSPQETENPILLVDGHVFIPACLAEGLYPIITGHHPAYNMVVVDNAVIPRSTGLLTSRADIRYQPDNRSPIAVRSPSGSAVVIFDENDGFTRVRNEDGIVGWVPTSSIGARAYSTPLEDLAREFILDAFIDNTAWRPPTRTLPVAMAWDDIGDMAVNYARMQVPFYDGLNVVAPTWFALDPAGMTLASLASREYAAWARAHGVEVWPAFEIPPGHTHAFLTDRAARQRITGQLVRYVDEFALGGINIDFEPSSPAEGPYFIQFLRELAIPLRSRGAILSVNAMPQESAFYRRDLLAATVDFVIIMAQDQYGPGAEISGPVAPIGFVQDSIKILLGYIPREQLVLGLPFYNRVWREVILDNTRETRQELHFGTAYTRDLFDYHGVAWEWLPVYASYYAEFADLEGDEAVRYRVWLECARSMDEKLQGLQAHQLAGVAVWNRNFRNNEELWMVLGRYFP